MRKVRALLRPLAVAVTRVLRDLSPFAIGSNAEDLSLDTFDHILDVPKPFRRIGHVAGIRRIRAVVDVKQSARRAKCQVERIVILGDYGLLVCRRVLGFGLVSLVSADR